MIHPARQSVDLSGYPELTVIYLGFRFTSLKGLRAVARLGRGLRSLEQARPPGLLATNFLLFGLNHVGLRQYWRDLESLEAFTRAEPHRTWWRDFGRDSQGAGFWHETYSRAGGMEAIYLHMPPTGFGRFAPAKAAEGPFFTARQRLQGRPA